MANAGGGATIGQPADTEIIATGERQLRAFRRACHGAGIKCQI